MVRDFVSVTETPGHGVTREALSMIYTRYAYAAALCAGRTVLEVGCGAGAGLGYLATKATRVVGGDFTARLLSRARQHYGERIGLVRLDAQALPFRAHSFDVVVLYETIYYLERPDEFFEECRRVLRRPGVVLICTANREWLDFTPSPFSTRYFSAQELGTLLRRHGFQRELFGAFPTAPRSARDRAVSVLKRLAVRLRLIPKTVEGRARLKRVFVGPLTVIPPEILPGGAEQADLVPLHGTTPVREYKVVYAVGRLP